MQILGNFFVRLLHPPQSRTFHESSKFGTNFQAISRKLLAKTTFLYSFFQNIKFENFRVDKFSRTFDKSSKYRY